MAENATSTNMLYKLPAMSWRGIALPIVERTHEFGHERVPHHFVYRDGVTTEMTGIQGRVFQYTVSMRETITVATYKNLFSKTLFELLAAYQDPSPGPLIDPIYGTITCTPGAWSERTDPARTDGEDIQLSFFEYTPIGEQVADAVPTMTGVYDAAKALDAEITRTEWTVQQPSPEPTTDPLSAATGVLEQVNNARERSDAMVMSVADKANDAERAAEKLGLAGEPVRRAARKLRLDSERLAKAPPRDKAGVLNKTVTNAPKTIAQLAAENNMTIAELLKSNAGLARTTLVPPGTSIFVRS